MKRSATADEYVLRAVYVPKSVDEALRGMALREGQSSNDVVRRIILEAVSESRGRFRPTG